MKVKFSVQLGRGASIYDLIQTTVLLEKRGFDTAWFADHLVTLDRNGKCLDPWPIMAALATHTSHLSLGSMVTDPFRRHPAVLAQTSATNDWISSGRMRIGIGAGEAMNTVPFNIPWDRRIRRLEETIRVLRLLWTGQTVDFEGEFFKLDKAFIQALPHNRSSVPIYVAANSPNSRKIAGAMGDGWIAELLSPEEYRKDLEEVTSAAKAVGRNPDELDVTYHVLSAISENSSAAKSAAHQMVKEMFTYWPKQLERYGHRISDRCDWNRLLVEENSIEEVRKLSHDVPDEVAEIVTISGNIDECIERIDQYVKVGVRHFAFSFGSTRDESMKLMGEKIIPYFDELFKAD
jgi:G6PDH family F420-dependent oxidoreductase